MKTILLMYGNFDPSQEHLARLAAIAPEWEIAVARSEKEALKAACETQIVLGHRYLYQILPNAPRLRCVCSSAAGVDHLIFPELKARSMILTRCPIFAGTIAQHALTLALSVIRGIPEAVVRQANGKWDADIAILPWPKRAMVLGMGMIGTELSGLLCRLGIEVTGVARTATRERAEGCSRMVTDNGWQADLGGMDLCFIALPLDESTYRLFDESVLRALPPHAVVVNVGRGEIVDMHALCTLLRENRLGGAATDVLARPYPGEDDPLWRTPRLLITPKIATYAPGRESAIERFMEDQVLRLMEGDPLLYRVHYDEMPESKDRWSAS